MTQKKVWPVWFSPRDEKNGAVPSTNSSPRDKGFATGDSTHKSLLCNRWDYGSRKMEFFDRRKTTMMLLIISKAILYYHFRRSRYIEKHGVRYERGRQGNFRP